MHATNACLRRGTLTTLVLVGYITKGRIRKTRHSRPITPTWHEDAIPGRIYIRVDP